MLLFTLLTFGFGCLVIGVVLGIIWERYDRRIHMIRTLTRRTLHERGVTTRNDLQHLTSRAYARRWVD